MAPCDWCIKQADGTVKCRVDNEGHCDFKTLIYDKQAILDRIDLEYKQVEIMLRGLKTATQDERTQAQSMVTDKIMGMKIMIDILQEQFHTKYMPKRNPFAFTMLVLEAKKYFK
jgi:hypothetical protein